MLRSILFPLLLLASTPPQPQILPIWLSIDQAHQNTCQVFARHVDEALGTPEPPQTSSLNSSLNRVASDTPSMLATTAEHLLALLQAYPGTSSAAKSALEAVLRLPASPVKPQDMTAFGLCAPITYLRALQALEQAADKGQLDAPWLRQALAKTVVNHARRELMRPTTPLNVSVVAIILHQSAQAGILGEHVAHHHFSAAYARAQNFRETMQARTEQEGEVPLLEELRLIETVRLDLRQALEQLPKL